MADLIRIIECKENLPVLTLPAPQELDDCIFTIVDATNFQASFRDLGALADDYQLQWSTNPAFPSPSEDILPSNSGNFTYTTITVADTDVLYYMRVRARNTSGESAWVSLTLI